MLNSNDETFDGLKEAWRSEPRRRFETGKQQQFKENRFPVFAGMTKFVVLTAYGKLFQDGHLISVCGHQAGGLNNWSGR